MLFHPDSEKVRQSSLSRDSKASFSHSRSSSSHSRGSSSHSRSISALSSQGKTFGFQLLPADREFLCILHSSGPQPQVRTEQTPPLSLHLLVYCLKDLHPLSSPFTIRFCISIFIPSLLLLLLLPHPPSSYLRLSAPSPPLTPPFSPLTPPRPHPPNPVHNPHPRHANPRPRLGPVTAPQRAPLPPQPTRQRRPLPLDRQLHRSEPSSARPHRPPQHARILASRLGSQQHHHRAERRLRGWSCRLGTGRLVPRGGEGNSSDAFSVGWVGWAV